METVLVTGGAGYIGSHTVQELSKQGVEVVVLDNLTTGHRDAVRVEDFYDADIADTELVADIIKEHQIKSIIHFAAKSVVSESLLKPELYFYENTVKSFNFFKTAIKAGIKNIVFSSTAAVYGIPENIPIKENTIIAPINPYGTSKHMIEEYLEWMGKVHGINWIALRYFNAAGASLDGNMGEDHHPESHLIPLVMQTMLGQREKLSIFGSDYATSDGTCIRDYIHVVDLAHAHILALQALEQGMPSKVYNLGTGRGHSVLELIKKSVEISGHELLLEYENRRAGDPPVLVADNTMIKSDLGWEPRHSDLETILTSAWNWHSNHPNGFEIDLKAV